MRTIGIYGGSFNPVHSGHIAVAEQCLRQGPLDELWFVVSPQNPLKNAEELEDAQGRLQEVREALKHRPEFYVSDIEFRLPRPSYMALTLKTLQERYPEDRFVLVIGGDNLDVFEQWKDYTYLLEHYDILVYPRPGCHNTVPPEWKRVRMIQAPLMDISSTQIRAERQKNTRK